MELKCDLEVKCELEIEWQTETKIKCKIEVESERDPNWNRQSPACPAANVWPFPLSGMIENKVITSCFIQSSSNHLRLHLRTVKSSRDRLSAKFQLSSRPPIFLLQREGLQ
jgi:hypothetical protein